MGLAKSMETKPGHDLTQSGVTLGTFDYISPEQALEPRDADVRSDIYSLGCTFYHVLTGIAPVPEGTAARKLHHHQHVKPADPRQFVPDLPLEVVQILDRMMAKNPRDRFQSPEQLVHQLLIVAKKLGIAPEVPDGLLSVEAVVPTPPSSRPLFWTAVAIVAVIALVLLLDQIPSSKPSSRPTAGTGTEVHEDKGTKGVGEPVRKVDQGQPATSGRTASKTARYVAPDGADCKHLLAWLQENAGADELEILLGSNLDLSPLQKDEKTGGLVVRARKVTLGPKEPGQKVTLRFNYEGEPRAKPVALTIDAREAQIEGIRFLVDARQAELHLTALLLRGGKHQVERCEFIQASPSTRFDPSKPFASVVADGSTSNTEVRLRDCAFVGFGEILEGGEDMSVIRFSRVEAGGQVAVVREGAARISADNCVFGPHAIMFRLEKVGGEESPLTISQCSMLLAAWRSTVFDVPASASARLLVSRSLFSRLQGETDEGAVLIRQQDDRPGGVVFVGSDNAYHDLDGYWGIGDNWPRASWSDFRKRMAESGNKDDSSVVVLSLPWQASDTQALAGTEQARLLETEQFARAFQVHLRHPTLRRPGRSEGSEVIGANRVLGDRIVPRTLPSIGDKTDLLYPRTLVVEPGSGDSANGLYSSVEAAIVAARPQDTIVLRHNGELKMDPVQLKTGLKDLTIRPARKFKPILIFGEPSEPEVSMFRVYDGKLRLEGLEFRLRPGKSEFKVQTVVALVGYGECVLKDCVVTLVRPSTNDTTLALATLSEPGKAMKLDLSPTRSRDQGPRLQVSNSFIRGEGDLVWCRANRPFAIEVKDSLMALSGSLLYLEVSPDAQVPPAAQKIRVSLTRSTTYLGGHLVRAGVSREPSGLVPIRCEVSSCLVLPASSGRALVHLEGGDASDDKPLRDKFTWEGDKNGIGTGYKTILAHESSEGTPTMMGVEKWRMQHPSDGSTFDVKAELPAATTAFSDVTARQIKVSDTSLKVGANLDRLPTPTATAPAGDEE
jgi:hypothetical protein